MQRCKNGAVKHTLAALSISLALNFAPPAIAKDFKPVSVPVTTEPIPYFNIGDRDQNIFGSLRFLGGLELFAGPTLGGLSGLRLSADRSQLMAVSDGGYFVKADITRDSRGIATGIHNMFSQQLLPDKKSRRATKINSDAEGLAVTPDTVLIAMERNNRVLRFKRTKDGFVKNPKRVKLNFKRKKLRSNKGLESVAVGPKGSALAGSIITIAERPPKKKTFIPAYILNGRLKGGFKITRLDGFDLTDADFLPSGDLLVLERRYRLREGVKMRIRRIAAKQLRPGAKVIGDIIMSADFSYQIDNMEGLAVTRNAAGKTIISLISDNNFVIFQRTLFLEFELLN